MAHGKAPAFIEQDGVRIQRDGGIPEAAHHLHFAGIVPDVGRHDTAGARRPLHLAHGLGLIGHEIEHEPRNCGVEHAVRDRDRLGVANLKGRARIGYLVASANETKPSEGSTPVTLRGDAPSRITSHRAPVPQPISSQSFFCGQFSHAADCPGDRPAPSSDIGPHRPDRLPQNLLAFLSHGMASNCLARRLHRTLRACESTSRNRGSERDDARWPWLERPI